MPEYHYHVTWGIDVYASNPTQAALAALKSVANPDSIAHVFIPRCRDLRHAETVDLDDVVYRPQMQAAIASVQPDRDTSAATLSMLSALELVRSWRSGGPVSEETIDAAIRDALAKNKKGT